MTVNHTQPQTNKLRIDLAAFLQYLVVMGKMKPSTFFTLWSQNCLVFIGFVFLAVVTCYFSTVLCVWKSPVHRLKSIRLCSGCVKVELEHIAMHYMCVSIVQAHGSSPYRPVQCSPSEVQLQSMRVPQLILLAQNNGGLVYELLRCWKPKLLFLSCQTLAMNTKTRECKTCSRTTVLNKDVTRVTTHSV